MSADSAFGGAFLGVEGCLIAVLGCSVGMVKVHAFWVVGFCGCLVLIGWCNT
jgi:hypothetical protein